jgi:phosphate transport system protein
MENRFDRELNSLYLTIVSMATLTESAVELLSLAMYGGKRDIMDEIEEKKREIERYSKESDAMCVNLLLRYHPVARDLRRISSATKIIADLERIGDNAQDVAEVMGYISNTEIYSEISLDRMCAGVKKMVQDAVQSYVSSDAHLADEVEKMDDTVDSCFLEAKKSLIALIRANSPSSDEAPDLMMIAKYLERMGDHAASISHWVIYENSNA